MNKNNVKKFCLTCFFSVQAFAYEIAPVTTPVPLSSNTAILKEISSAVSSIAETSQKALVFVSVSQTLKNNQVIVDPFEFFFGNPMQGPGGYGMEPPKREGLGSGFFIDLEKGYILTNNHVIDGADTIELKLANDETYPGKVIGRDPSTDVAVVQVSNPKYNQKGLSQLVLGDSEEAKVGTFVIALGAPFGLNASMSFGVISATGRGNMDITRLGNFIQTDAAINPGNSGGPLIGTDGKVVGINTAILSRSGGFNGVGFAVPSNLVRSIATDLINKGKVQRGQIGVYLRPLQEEWISSLNLPQGTTGSIIAKVVEGSPAKKAGLLALDVIVKIGDKKIHNENEVINEIGSMKPGASIVLQVYRAGVLKKFTVTLDAAKS